MKILHILSQRPDSTGSGMYVQAMIKEAAKCGIDNYLVAGISETDNIEIDFIEKDKTMFAKFNNSDVAFNIPGMSDVMPYESVKFSDLKDGELFKYEEAFSVVLQKAVKKFKPDIIHSHHLWLVSSIAYQLFPNIPFITSSHGTDLRQFQNCPQFQERVLIGCKQIDTILALSEDQKNEIVRLYNIKPERIIVVGAGFNADLFYYETKLNPDPVQIIYAGKLSNAKGVPWLLKALKDINIPNWQLHLVGGGSGEEKEYSLRLAKELGNKVQIHGAIPQKQLAHLLRQSHIFILPSFYEGLPLVILEALACGCRVVATDLPGIKEIVYKIRTDFIDLIKTPRLSNLDKPYKEDENKFIQNLKISLERQIIAAEEIPQIDLHLISGKLNSYKWCGVFSQVSKVYRKYYNGI